MDLGLQGRVALSTGGSKGIGQASALGLAREGADIAIGARGRNQFYPGHCRGTGAVRYHGECRDPGPGDTERWWGLMRTMAREKGISEDEASL